MMMGADLTGMLRKLVALLAVLSAPDTVAADAAPDVALGHAIDTTTRLPPEAPELTVADT